MLPKSSPISFNDVRLKAGLSPIAAGLPGHLNLVAPANANSVNNAIIAVTRASDFSTEAASGLPKDKSATNLVKSFSWRSQDIPLTPVLDQGICGCCWAVASSSCINDRIAIKTRKNPFFHFQELMACEGTCPPCSTCSVEAGFLYASTSGLTPSVDLQSSKFLQGMQSKAKELTEIGIPPGVVPATEGAASTGGGLVKVSTTTSMKKSPPDVCSKTQKVLFGNQKKVKTVVDSGPISRSASILALKRSVMYEGPVVTIMRIYSDFIVGSSPGSPAFESTEGVYIHRHGKTNYGVAANRNTDLGTHCMLIVGWGTSKNGIPYWEIRNSWGTNWGDGGYCKVAMTSGTLNNASVGVDLAITSIKNNIATYNYGNIWVSVSNKKDAPVYGNSICSLTYDSGKYRQLRGGLFQKYKIVFLTILSTALLLLFLYHNHRSLFSFSGFEFEATF